jgi:hypothetical protein
MNFNLDAQQDSSTLSKESNLTESDNGVTVLSCHQRSGSDSAGLTYLVTGKTTDNNKAITTLQPQHICCTYSTINTSVIQSFIHGCNVVLSNTVRKDRHTM